VVDKILEELLRSRKFSILDRASRDIIWQERNFQITSGEIKQSEIKEVGKGLGADYVVIVKVTRVGTLLSMSTTMVNVETLEVIAQSSSEAKDSVENLLKLASYCGEQMAFSFDGTAAPPKTAVAEEPAIEDSIGQAEITAIKTDARVMLKKKLFMSASGQKAIAAKVGALPLSDKQGLYQEFKKESAGAFLGLVGNLLPIVKLGSLIQGDMGGFFLYGGLESLGILLVSASLDLDDENLLETGATVFVVSYLVSLFQPFFYVNSWNKNLAKSLSVRAVLGERENGLRLAARESPGLLLGRVSYRY
jgi:hypothetical protein